VADGEEDEEGVAGTRGGVGLPPEPEERSGKRRRRDPVLLHAIAAAAVDLPRLTADALAAIPARRLEVVVESDEVERGPDSDDPRNHVQPAGEEVEPLVRVGIHKR